MPKKKTPTQSSTSDSQPQSPTSTPTTPTTPTKTRGPNSTTVVVSMKTAMKDALQQSADINLKSLSGQAAQYILEGLKRDGLLPAQRNLQEQPSSPPPSPNPQEQPDPSIHKPLPSLPALPSLANPAFKHVPSEILSPKITTPF